MTGLSSLYNLSKYGADALTLLQNANNTRSKSASANAAPANKNLSSLQRSVSPTISAALAKINAILNGGGASATTQQFTSSLTRASAYEQSNPNYTVVSQQSSTVTAASSFSNLGTAAKYSGDALNILQYAGAARVKPTSSEDAQPAVYSVAADIDVAFDKGGAHVTASRSVSNPFGSASISTRIDASYLTVKIAPSKSDLVAEAAALSGSTKGLAGPAGSGNSKFVKALVQLATGSDVVLASAAR